MTIYKLRNVWFSLHIPQVIALNRSVNTTVFSCEIKFYNDDITFSKKNADDLRRKRRVFKNATKTKKQVFIVLITTYGMVQNKYSLGVVDNVLGMEELF